MKKSSIELVALAFTSILAICGSQNAWTRSEPVVGREAAEKYMGRPPAQLESDGNIEPINRSPDGAAAGSHYLAIHVGAFVDSQAWAWGHNGTPKKIGDGTFGLTYRFGAGAPHEYDWAIRIDYLNYSLPQGSAAQISFLPMLIFPEAESQFPLYFGAGVGPGIFFKQTPNSSPLSLDYQLVGGVRLFDLYKSTGFFIETGVKNHLNLIGAGQFNGLFISVGALFTF